MAPSFSAPAFPSSAYPPVSPDPTAMSPYSGAAGGQPSTTIVRRGWVSVKEEGLRSWIWSKRWLILRESTLTMHKNEVRASSLYTLGLLTDIARQASSNATAFVHLSSITNVQRIDMKPYCIELETKDKSWYFVRRLAPKYRRARPYPRP
jgi:protein-serine/threonine kinase